MNKISKYVKNMDTNAIQLNIDIQKKLRYIRDDLVGSLRLDRLSNKRDDIINNYLKYITIYKYILCIVDEDNDNMQKLYDVFS
jgi:hypothetical protein